MSGESLEWKKKRTERAIAANPCWWSVGRRASRSPQMSRQFWSGRAAEGALKDFESFRWHPGRCCYATATPTLSLTRHRLCCGWHPRGNFCSSLRRFLPAMCAIFRRPLLAPGGIRPTSSPSHSCFFAVSLSRPPAHPIRRQSVSQ